MGENQSKELPQGSQGKNPAPPTNTGPELSAEEVRRLRLEKIEREQAQREAEEQKLTRSPERNQNFQKRSPEKSKPVEEKIPVQETKPTPVIQEVKPQPPAKENINIKPVTTQTQPQTVPSLPAEILNHPVFKKSGKEAYVVHSYLEDVFQGTCVPFSLQKNGGLKLYEGQEFESFTLENFDDVIQSLLESPLYYSAEQKLVFLFDVFERLGTEELTGVVSEAKRNEFRKTAISYLTSYLDAPEIFAPEAAPENPGEMLDMNSPIYNALYEYLTGYDREGIIAGILQNIDESSFPTVITPLFKRIARDCRESQIDNTRKLTSGISLLETLIFADKRIIEFLVKHPLYILEGLPNKNGIYFQKLSLFGACLSLTAFPHESPAAKQYCNEKIDLRRPEPTLKGLRDKIHQPIESVHRIMEYMMKADKKYKKYVVDWFYEALLLNDAKQKTLNMGAMVSSTGWFTNFLVLLFKFCQKPLEDINKYPNWFTKIDTRYIGEKPLFKDVSLLNGRSNNYVEATGGDFSFLTELIYMTTHALLLHKPANDQFLQFLQKVQEAAQEHGQMSPTFLEMYKTKLGYDVQLLDPYVLNQTLKLLTFDALFIIHAFEVPVKQIEELEKIFELTQLIKGDNFNAKPSIPVSWAENVEEYLLFYRQVQPSLLISHQTSFEILADFMLSIFANPNWIVNPHLKGKCIRFLSALLPREDDAGSRQKDENFSFIFKQNQFYEKYLVSGLVEFFVEAEKSGYYEKYNYRHSAALIINYLLRTVFPYGKTSYVAESLDRMAKENYDVYLRFIMLYLNDIINFLDEAFKKLRDIKKYEDDVDRDGLAELNQMEKQERQRNYESDKKQCQVFSTFLKTFYQMGAAITKVSPDFFLTEEIKEKFIVNLNYILDGLNGENATSLKVKNMKELEFDPKFLLETVVQIYLNFSDKEEFVRGVSKDERSFRIELFYKTAQIMDKYSILGPEDTYRFQEFISKLEVQAQEKKKEDAFMAEITDIPDEFLDPIMGEIMKDPVLLPSSQMVVDRITIAKHLLSDDTDPFNRSKLTKEMLEPQPELKKRIEDFFAEKRKNMK